MKKYVILFIPLILVLSLNIYFRTFPVNFPQLKNRAEDIIEQKISEDAAQDTERNFPAFSALAKEGLINTFISDYKEHKKEEIKKQIQQEYLKLKDRYQDASGQTYLMELDCWHWGRYTENVLRYGRPGDRIVNGRQWDDLMLAPEGSQVVWSRFLFYLSAFLYRAFSLFKPVPLFTFLFYLPLFFTAIFIVVLYLFCFYRWGLLSAIISCLFIGLAPIFLPRSCAGWFDTDILNILLPLVIAWTYLKSYGNSSFRQKLFWLCFSSFWLGLFSFTWIGWWFIFIIILIYEIYSSMNLVFTHWQYKEKNLSLVKAHLVCLGSFILFSFLWVILLAGVWPLMSLLAQVKEALILNKPLIVSVWPNVNSTVQEFGRADVERIARYTGGVFLFVLSLVCMLALFLRTARNRKSTGFEHEFIVLIVFWFLSMFFACFRGIRFTAFILIPLGISLGWMASEVYRFFRDKKKKWIVLCAIIIMISLAHQFITNAYDTAKNIFPLMDDSWYKLLSNLKETTPSDAIINSWWDFGDWFKTVSRHRVIFDGQSQNTPQAFWMSRVLLNPSEEEAVRILRMLNNAGNSAFESIDKQFKDPFKSVLFMENLISYPAKEAKELALKFLPATTAAEVIKLLFANPAKAYFIVDYTMPGKIGPISYLGNWDFAKVYLAQNLNREPKNQLIDYLIKSGRDSQQAQRFYQEARLIPNRNLDNWISHPLKFYSAVVSGEKKNDIVFFDDGFVYSPREQRVYLYSLRDNKYKIPKSLFILENDKLKEIVYPDNNLDFSILIFKVREENYRAILLDRELANSLLVRLYFLAGSGLKQFKPFMEEKDGDDYIRVFEIVWD